MKYLVLLLVIFVGFISCQKELTNTVFNPFPDSLFIPIDTGGSFEADIDSVHWKANYHKASFSIATPLLPRQLTILGKSADGRTLSIIVTDTGLHHIYSLTGGSRTSGAAFADSSFGVAYTTNQNQDSTLSGTVEVQIDTIKKTVSGTFSFVVYRRTDSSHKIVTKGKFTNLYYGSDYRLPHANATDTFHVKIKDTLFEPYSISADYISPANSIDISGSDSLVTRTLGIAFSANVVPGTYTFSLPDYSGVYNTSLAIFQSDSGKIEILQHDTTSKRIRGNFYFHASSIFNPADSLNLTQGYFSVKYH